MWKSHELINWNLVILYWHIPCIYMCYLNRLFALSESPFSILISLSLSVPKFIKMPAIAFGRFDDSFSWGSIKAYIAEFISTLLFVFAGVGSAIAYGYSSSFISSDFSHKSHWHIHINRVAINIEKEFLFRMMWSV